MIRLLRTAGLAALISLAGLLTACFEATSSCDTAIESGGGGAGRTGSLARFQVSGDKLYALSGDALQTYDVSEPSRLAFESQVPVAWDIETLFARDTLLYIGSRTGMHIYTLGDPSRPAPAGQVSHFRSCDPVVVEGGLAYVTLRAGGLGCWGGSNELQIYDVADPYRPALLKTFPMVDPHGLGIDRGRLFIGDGAAGLKVYRVGKGLSLELIDHVAGVTAYDVIPGAGAETRLVLIASEGLSQYDYAEFPMRRLSTIPIGAGSGGTP